MIFIQKRQNGYGRFVEITEFGRGGKRSQVVLPEGRESCGWRHCIIQLGMLVKHNEKQGISLHKKKTMMKEQLVVEGRSFAEVAEGKQRILATHPTELPLGLIGDAAAVNSAGDTLHPVLGCQVLETIPAPVVIPVMAPSVKYPQGSGSGTFAVNLFRQ